MIKTSNI